MIEGIYFVDGVGEDDVQYDGEGEGDGGYYSSRGVFERDA